MSNVQGGARALGDFYSDAEVDALCDGLQQNAAKIRYLRDTLKLRVHRKPNGRPLAWRPDLAAPAQNAPKEPAGVIAGLEQWASDRKARNGQKA